GWIRCARILASNLYSDASDWPNRLSPSPASDSQHPPFRKCVLPRTKRQGRRAAVSAVVQSRIVTGTRDSGAGVWIAREIRQIDQPELEWWRIPMEHDLLPIR